MQRRMLGVAALIVLASTGAFAVSRAHRPPPALAAEALARRVGGVGAAPGVPAERLEFREFFEPGAGLRPSARLRALAGKRVRLVGFMAELELPPRGAFYLVPRPVRCDESGAGSADLPPESVLVISAASAGKAVPQLGGALEVTGLLEVGSQTDSEGRVARLRLRLDADPEEALGAAPASIRG